MAENVEACSYGRTELKVKFCRDCHLQAACAGAEGFPS